MTEGAMELQLNDLRSAMTELNQTRKRMNIGLWDLESKSGVSRSAFCAWKSSSRSPSLCGLVAVAEFLGFDMMIRHATGRTHHVTGILSAMRVVRAEARARRLTLPECERLSGISVATFSALASGSRDTRITTMVAIAKAFDLTLYLRRRA